MSEPLRSECAERFAVLHLWVRTDPGRAYLSVGGPNVASMDSRDTVDPADAALHRLLGDIADKTPDDERRERILDLMMTAPPVAEWPPDAVDQWRDAYQYIRSLRRDLERRELDQIYNSIDEGEVR